MASALVMKPEVEEGGISSRSKSSPFEPPLTGLCHLFRPVPSPPSPPSETCLANSAPDRRAPGPSNAPC